MLVGLFEPVGAPWSLDGVPRDFSFGKLPPDWERLEPFLGPALARIPCLTDTGVRTFFCGPESFTADVKPLHRPGARAGRLLRRGRAQLARHPVRRRRRQRRRAVDRRRASRRSTRRTSPSTAPPATRRRARFRRERTVEQLGVLFGDAVWPSWKPSTARNIRRSVLHDRLAGAGRALRPVGGLGVPGVVRRAGRAPGGHAGLRPSGGARHRGPRARRGPRGRRRAGHDAHGQVHRAGPGRRQPC